MAISLVKDNLVDAQNYTLVHDIALLINNTVLVTQLCILLWATCQCRNVDHIALLIDLCSYRVTDNLAIS